MFGLFRVKAVSLMEGSHSHGWTAASAWTARGPAADTEAPEFQWEQGRLKNMQANPNKGF